MLWFLNHGMLITQRCRIDTACIVCCEALSAMCGALHRTSLSDLCICTFQTAAQLHCSETRDHACMNSSSCSPSHLQRLPMRRVVSRWPDHSLMAAECIAPCIGNIVKETLGDSGDMHWGHCERGLERQTVQDCSWLCREGDGNA